MLLQQLLDQGIAPIIAILRGIEPSHVQGVGAALVEGGIRAIEVPLNSPRALQSIERLRETLPADALVGAGTVTSVESVNAVAAAGGQLVVAPNTNIQVIARSIELGLEILPGSMTPSEAWAAYVGGARHLKLFPASSCGMPYLKALLEVLPRDCHVWAVGGTNPDNLGEWLAAGAVGVGIGGALYRAGASADSVARNAAAIVTAWRATCNCG